MFKKSDFQYELFDCGDGRKIEKFGDFVVNRPCPQATWNRKIETLKPSAFFDREKKQWQKETGLSEKWVINIGKIRAELRFAKNGQVGIFPEQLDNWQWMAQKISNNANRPLKILNTFAYTGMSTLFSCGEHTEVCHVDGASSAILQAKKNAELSGLGEAKIRWICDDVMAFMRREIRRGNHYDAIILDPPAFGRGGKNEWKINKDLPKLMGLVEQLLTKKPLFVVLTCHAPRYFSAEDLVRILEGLPQFFGKKAEKLVLEIPSEKGHPLISGFGARICL